MAWEFHNSTVIVVPLYQAAGILLSFYYVKKIPLAILIGLLVTVYVAAFAVLVTLLLSYLYKIRMDFKVCFQHLQIYCWFCLRTINSQNHVG